MIGDTLIEGDLRDFLKSIFRQYRSFSCQLIIDRSDEEFVLDTLPTIRASLGRKAIAVKCARHFSKDAFSVGMVVGKINDGQSSRVLCAGVENRNSLQKFMQVVDQLGIVFAGIYSLAILLAYQSKRSKFRSDTLLVLSSQEGRTWRYSLVKCGRLLMSRCVFIGDAEDLWQEVIVELESTRAYADRLIGDNESMTCVYAGPKMRSSPSLAGKLIASMSRRYRMFDSDDLYKAVISRSHFIRWRHDVYRSGHSIAVYRRYFWANASIATSLLILLASVISVYITSQNYQDKQQKILALRNNIIEIQHKSDENLADNKLSGLKLVDLRRLVEVFSTIDFNRQARTLVYRLASVLSRYSSIDLLEISFEKESEEERAQAGLTAYSVKNTVLTATFIVRGNESMAYKIAGFYSAIEEENLLILEKSNTDTQVSNKGRLGRSAVKLEFDAEKFTVSMILRPAI